MSINKFWFRNPFGFLLNWKMEVEHMICGIDSHSNFCMSKFNLIIGLLIGEEEIDLNDTGVESRLNHLSAVCECVFGRISQISILSQWPNRHTSFLWSFNFTLPLFDVFFAFDFSDCIWDASFVRCVLMFVEKNEIFLFILPLITINIYFFSVDKLSPSVRRMQQNKTK